MKTASLMTKDSDIDVVLGDFTFDGDPRAEAYGSLKYLYTDLTDIRKYYIRLGFHLQEFKMFFNSRICLTVISGVTFFLSSSESGSISQS